MLSLSRSQPAQSEGSTIQAGDWGHWGPGTSTFPLTIPSAFCQEVGGVDALKPETFESLLPDARAVVMLSSNW